MSEPDTYPSDLAFAVRAGGAGKTQDVVNIGVSLARRGFKVRAWDLDPQRGLSHCLGYTNPARGQRTVYDVLLAEPSAKSLNDAMVPARYRKGLGEDAKAFETIPNFFLVHGTQDMGNAEVTLGADPSGNLWLANLRDSLSEEADAEEWIDLVDCGPTRGILQTSIMVAFSNFVGCVYDEFKYIQGLYDLEEELATARRKLRRVGCTAEIKHILAVGIPLKADGSVDRSRGAVTDDSIKHIRANEDWAPKLLPLVRKDVKAKETFFHQKPLRFHAPLSGALDDIERVVDALGYPRRAPALAS